jgi:spore cortex formation protein SpoVR/YcgB (stage V sporulation)
MQRQPRKQTAGIIPIFGQDSVEKVLDSVEKFGQDSVEKVLDSVEKFGQDSVEKVLDSVEKFGQDSVGNFLRLTQKDPKNLFEHLFETLVLMALSNTCSKAWPPYTGRALSWQTPAPA